MSAFAEPPDTGPRLSAARWLGYGGITVTAIVVPLALNLINPFFVDEGFGKGYAIFSLFAASASLAVTVIAVCEIRRRWNLGLAALLPIVLGTLVAFHTLIPLGEHRAPTSDYRRYQVAAEDVLVGRNPYLIGGARKYLYPPLTAQAFATAYRVVVGAQSVFGRAENPEQAWLVVFYLYQCGQLLLVLLAYSLCFLVLRDLGVGRVPAHLLGAGVLLFNVALADTLRHNQVNLLLLDLVLLGLWSVRRHPALAGLALALAAHLKVYPLILLAPLAALRHGRVVVWTLAAVVAVGVLQTGLAGDGSLWESYLTFMRNGFPTEHASIRNTSLLATSYHLCRAAAGDCDRYLPALRWFVRVLAAGVVVWYVRRGFGWMRRARESRLRGAGASSPPSALLFLSAADALAFALLLSPIVWDHHYLLTMPLALCALVLRTDRHPWPVGVGVVLLLLIPAFGIHRIAGLVVLLMVTAPSPIEKPFTAARWLARPETGPT